jgi:NTP pyrophosphatase (non-canonical NTP hydrolase)
VRLGRELVRASNHWFPETHGRGEWDVIRHFALGIGGEAGEVLDVVKKADVCGGFAETCDKHPDGKHSISKLADEIGDLLTYLLELAVTVGIDPEEAVRGCQAKCAERWGAVPARPPAPANSRASS